MDTITKDQYKVLRRQGLSQDQIKDLQTKGKVSETLNRQTFKEKGLLRSVGGFLGMEEFGRGIAATINKPREERMRAESMAQTEQVNESLRKAYSDAVQRGDTRAATNLEKTIQQSIGQSQDFASGFQGRVDLGVSNREVIGSAIQTGLTFGSLLGAGPTAQGVGKLTGLTAPTVKQAVIRGAGAGALGGAAFGGAEAITENEAVAPGIAKGAAMGAATGGVLSGVGQYISNLAKITPGDRILEQTDAMKTLRRKFDQNTVYRTVDGKREVVSDPISTIVQAKIKPEVVGGKINADTARTQIRELINQADDQVQQSIQNAEIPTATLKQLKETAIDLAKSNKDLQAGGKVNKVVKQMTEYFDDYAATYGDELATADISSIRSAMNRSFNPDTVDVERTLGDAARKILYKNAPGSRELLVREGQLIAADKFLDALHGRAVKGGRLGGYFNNLLGAMVGGSTDIPVAGPLVGALGANKLTEIIQRSALDPITPKMARGFTTAIEALPTDTAGNISKTAILSLIGQLSNQPTQQQDTE